MPLQDVLALLAVLTAGTFLLRPVALALAERLRGAHAREPETQRQIAALREELLTELQVTRREMADLGERLDFAERLLAREREAPRLRDGQ
jgi:hypothetical protein